MAASAQGSLPRLDLEHRVRDALIGELELAPGRTQVGEGREEDLGLCGEGAQVPAMQGHGRPVEGRWKVSGRPVEALPFAGGAPAQPASAARTPAWIVVVAATPTVSAISNSQKQSEAIRSNQKQSESNRRAIGEQYVRSAPRSMNEFVRSLSRSEAAERE